MGVAMNLAKFFVLLLEYCLGENGCISIIWLLIQFFYG